MIWGSQANPGESEYFGFDLIRKYVVVFGSLFSDIVIQRSVANNETQLLKVPLHYAPKEKMLLRLESDADLNRPYSTLVPVMTFELSPGSPFIYDGERKIPALNKNVVQIANNDNYMDVQYAEVPYNIYFNLTIFVKNAEDGAKIIEQILPFFQPDYTPKVNLIPNMNVTRTIPIILLPNSGITDLYDGKFENRQVLFYTLPFLVRGYFYGPIREKPIIKVINMNMHAGLQTVNAGSTTINSTINSTMTTIDLSAGGNQAVGVPVSGTYYARIDQEIVYVANIVSNTILTVQRAQQNTTANSHWSGATFTALIENVTAETISVQPGLTNTGLPTQFAAQSIPYSEIAVSDDYGFTSTTTIDVE